MRDITYFNPDIKIAVN